MEYFEIIDNFRFQGFQSMKLFWKYIHSTHNIDSQHNLLQITDLKAGNNYKDY